MSVHTKPVASKSVLASLAAVVASTILASSAVLPVGARESSPAGGAAAEVVLSTLPPQARQTHALIRAGGPFPYAKDGSVFVNRERLLPLHPRGYYREYTVKTPGLSHRGARRIVCGGNPPKSPDACYYTADHYASFSRIVQ
jgi:ribonuclease T1